MQPYPLCVFLHVCLSVLACFADPAIFTMTQHFDPEQFMLAPSQEAFHNLKKDDLLSLGKHLSLEVKKSMRKDLIQQIITKHLVSLKIFEGSVLESLVASDVEVRKLELELELRKLDAQKERELRELEFKDRELREREKEREAQIEKQRLDHELEMKKLEVQEKLGSSYSVPGSSAKFDVSKYIKLVPPFHETDVDKYFLHFEKIAQNLEWPKKHWPMLLQSVLIGKAREIYTQLSVDQALDYDSVKQLILKGYELVPEAYRQKFRNQEKESSETYVEFARTKEQLFDRWCSSQEIDNNYDRLRQLILVEEFKRCIPSSVRTFIDEQKAETLEKAARLADDYSLTHKDSFVGKPHQSFSPSRQNPSSSSLGSSLPGSTRNIGKEDSRRDKGDNGSCSGSRIKLSISNSKPPLPKRPFNSVVCNYCKKEGHVLSDCLKLKRKQQGQNESKPTGLITSSRSIPQFCDYVDDKLQGVKSTRDSSYEVSLPSKPIMETFEPFIHDGFVSLTSDLSYATAVKILRDTGASQSLLLADTLPFSDKSAAGANVLIKGVESSNYTPVPLHNVYLSSNLVSGPVTLGVRPSLPFDGVHLLLGNDLAGDKVAINPLVTEKPCFDQNPDPIEKEIPGLYPSCAVTRAMSRKMATEDDINSDVDLTDTFLSQVYETDLPNMVEEFKSSEKISPDVSFSDYRESLSKGNLIAEQHKDPDISCLFQRTVDENEISSNPVCYFVKNGVLIRKWRPPDVSAEDEWAVKYQVVIPKAYQREILSMAHETPLAGHLGVNKTYWKILSHFYWPGLKKDVAEFCRSCNTCQIVGKPNQSIPKAPLQPIPAFEEPFSRIIIDCVGPLPRTRSGNQYLLTIMCASTRFPEAIPLRNIKTKTIVKALTKFFSMFGLPKSIQSDQGSNFMSGVFQQVMHELGIKQYNSSAYHPESQGSLERFHQTYKNMIRTYCYDTEKDWDEGVHLLLFAARESVQESLGFSPFELVFGHTVRGPLKLLKEKFISSSDESLNLLQYVSDFRTRLTRACELARANLVSAQKSMKSRYDLNTVNRTFIPGQKVLALLPVSGNPLRARYFGPYVIDKKLSDLNYVVVTPDRRKDKQLCHVNMLKPYVDRDSTVTVHPVNVVTSDPDEVVSSCNGNSSLPATAKLMNSDIFQDLDSKLSHLPPSQRQDLEHLLQEFEHLFPDVPTRTDKIYHDVDVGDAKPVKQHPYRLNPAKQKYLHEEVKYLLENDFIEPSKSNWSSPCILVPKPDGTYRMCTDYRKVNNVTKSDTFPIPRMDDCIDRIGSAKYVTKFDLLKGFWQVPLTDRAKEISAFVTPDGLFQYKVAAFGMKNSPATFQRLINDVIAGLDGCEAYIDDIVIYSDTWEDHLRIIRTFFERLTEAKLTVNLAKSEFARAHVTYLGHVVGQGQVKPVDAKISAISDFPRPESKKQLMRFLGMAGYYRKFCPNFSAIAEPLTQLLSKKAEFVWTEKCERAFDELKAILKSAPVLSAPDFNHQFKLAVDASDAAAGAVLLQEDKDGVDHPICYFSRKFNKSQKNYSTVEKECLALVLALQHFEVYVSSSSLPVVVFSDHNPLVFLHKLKNKNQRLLRWSLMLQEYNLDIRHIKGKDNVIADCLSRA